MMRNLRVLLSIATIAALAPLARAQSVLPEAEQYSVRLEGRLWGPGLSAEMQMSGSQTGTVIDVPNDLAVGDKSTYQLRLNVQLGTGHKLRFNYTKLDYDGDTQIKKEIKFGDTTYPRFTHLVSSLKGSYYSGDYEWDLAKGQYGYFGLCFGAKVFDVDGLLVAPERGDRDVETFRVPVPVLGVVTEGYYGRFGVGGELTAFTIGKTANFVELDLNTHFALTGQLGVVGGFRFFKIHGEHSNDMLDMKLSGLYFGAEVNF
jgi:hypothetical protein